MEDYDVVIAGAGPAGAELARELAKAGKRVLLAERNRDFTINSYSSAGVPDELLANFNLPDDVIGTEWNKIEMHSSNNVQIWEQKEPLGVVLDFMKLRKFLAEDAVKHGAVLRFGFFCIGYEDRGSEVIVRFKEQKEKQIREVSAKVLVDATGSERQVLAKSKGFQGNSFPSTGIEYLIEVPEQVYNKWANALSIFMGKEWMPQGYSWIFPMEPNKLKVGLGRYFQNDNFVPHEKSYTHYLNIMMEKCLGSTDFPILDRHGKTIVYTYNREDLHYDGNVVAIGDCVSTINPLAFEGIRHAMSSSRSASKHILDHLQGDTKAFEKYQKELHALFGFKWKLCESLMHIIYKEPNDENIDLMIEAFKGLTFKELFDLAFHYKFFSAMKFIARYTFLTTKHKVKSLLIQR